MNSLMKTIIVTCGPGFEPIDEARRLTNMSTGQLGVLLSERLAAAGHRVLCFKGSGATWPDPRSNVEVQKFDTNNDLHLLFQQVAKEREVSTIFHTAALCDYKVKTVTNETGSSIHSEKIPTSGGNIFLELEPSLKVLPLLRPLFPSAKIIGWKYELSGTREDALAKAKKQITMGKTNACVVNGKAFGQGFGFYTLDQPLSET
jgi:phosphopantothenoylcysteine synthetase/decarboxylase